MERQKRSPPPKADPSLPSKSKSPLDFGIKLINHRQTHSLVIIRLSSSIESLFNSTLAVTMKFAAFLAVLLLPLAFAKHDTSRILRMGKKKKKTSSKSSGKGKSSKALIDDPYDFVRAVVMEGWCTAFPLEASYACANCPDLTVFAIKTSLIASDNLQSYCCKDFSSYVDLAAMVTTNAACATSTAVMCLGLDPSAPPFDVLFIPYEPVGATAEMTPGVCCSLAYPFA